MIKNKNKTNQYVAVAVLTDVKGANSNDNFIAAVTVTCRVALNVTCVESFLAGTVRVMCLSETPSYRKVRQADLTVIIPEPLNEVSMRGNIWHFVVLLTEWDKSHCKVQENEVHWSQGKYSSDLYF